MEFPLMRILTLSCLFLLLTTATAPGQEPARSGFPSEAAAQKARDDADFERAVVAYRFWYPTVSLEAVFQSRREEGGKTGARITILSAQPQHQILTANSDTPYASCVLDVSNGYTIELPPGPFVGVVNDHYQGWVLDLGLPGADKGKGGKYHIFSPEPRPDRQLFNGTVPSNLSFPVESGGYYLSRSRSNKVFVVIRALPVKGDLVGAERNLRTIKISRPVGPGQPDQVLTFEDRTSKTFDSTPLRWEDNLQYWQKLHEVIEAEPLVPEFKPMYGLLTTLGIEKDKPFAPDSRMKGILEKAAKQAASRCW